MAKAKKSRWAIVGVLLVIAAAGYFFIDQAERDKARAAAANAPSPGIPVTVGVAEQRDMPVYVRGIGTVQAYKTVTVKSRVDGQIVKVSFEEGQEVKAGDPLFQIDVRPFQATLDQATANKQRDQAQLAGAQADLDRFSKLVGRGFQSRQSVDQQTATVDALKGSIAADEAAIETAKLNLDYANIRSPVDGRTGSRLVDLGNLIQAGQNTALVTVTQIKPIYVNFTVPQDQTDAIRTNQAKGPLTVVAYASDDKTELSRGTVTLIDNQIDSTTGTLRLKGTFGNADERLWPGEFVNARLILSTRKGAVTVPQRTVMQGADDSYIYVVKPDSTVERRTVKVAMSQDGVAAIETGLALGEKVVVDGQYRLTNGARVRLDTPPPGQSRPDQPAAAQTAHGKD
ncbi:MAG: efflux RND transporter periplasmic adaptor subunit [Reyranella sp.]|uniref:efflux RND transporter periplasmic adaptor subunit n=1 Tax=Reyranella sp. TaxID=1929291 RepID=UPI001ACDCF9D|nr:efflux RND transporter periplasmic adaptor subunit [Reyranella sp.]MBN9085694.1 efflux RND transporter periplasmic adaptor subunit [Reyranella sp.]